MKSTLTVKTYIEYLIKKLNKTSFKPFEESEFYNKIPQTLDTDDFLILWDKICSFNNSQDSFNELLNLSYLLKSNKDRYTFIHLSLNINYIFFKDPIYYDLLNCLFILQYIIKQNLYTSENIYLEDISVFNKKFNKPEFVKYLEELKLNLYNENSTF
jgi:hypothetical protein